MSAHPRTTAAMQKRVDTLRGENELLRRELAHIGARVGHAQRTLDDALGRIPKGLWAGAGSVVWSAQYHLDEIKAQIQTLNEVVGLD